ncbi:hypothetical protein Tco_0798671 [Tanacetum coccineum]
MNYAKETQNNSKWSGYNGYNGSFVNRRNYEDPNRGYNGYRNIGRWDYRKKQDTKMGGTSNGVNRDAGVKSQTEKEESQKGKSIEEKSKGNDNSEGMRIGKENMNDAGRSSYNRFTFLNELIGEEELVPNVDQRKIVDEYMNKEDNENDIGKQGWNKEMEKYYRDRKELFDAAKSMEQNEDVECDDHNEVDFGQRNKDGGREREALI